MEKNKQVSKTLYEVLEQSAQAALSLQNADGSMPPGHNGPWQNQETPLRNTGYWLILFLFVYQLTGRARFKIAAEKATTYLISEEVRPGNATFFHRYTTTKERCNGLIGQAWTIEALCFAATELEWPELVNLAQKVFLLHPFNFNAGLWQMMEIDGQILGYKRAINQQIWFAAVGLMTLNQQSNNRIRYCVDRFMRRLPGYLNVDAQGRICHRIVPIASVKDYAKMLYRCWQKSDKQNMDYDLRVGYHTFNLYGLALIKGYMPDQAIWRSEKLKSALQYLQSEHFRKDTAVNEYCYGYNPTGIEVAFVWQMFIDSSNIDMITFWLNQQIDNHYDFETGFMQRNSPDPMTLAARLYEAVRLPDLPIGEAKR